MDLKDIQALIKFVSKSGVHEVDLKTDDFKIIIKNSASPETVIQQMNTPIANTPVATAPIAVAPAAPVAVAPVAPVAAAPVAAAPVVEEESKYIEIKSPMIGTFYRKPSPDKDVFASVGDVISSGDTVCVVEAMKLFNEIESEISGKIVKVLVEDSTPVEFDQPLFLVDPS